MFNTQMREQLENITVKNGKIRKATEDEKLKMKLERVKRVKNIKISKLINRRDNQTRRLLTLNEMLKGLSKTEEQDSCKTEINKLKNAVKSVNDHLRKLR